jgi:hypothetical protein
MRRQLEEIVDVRQWQSDLEVARVQDHHELLSMGHRIERGNAAIERELALQGGVNTISICSSQVADRFCHQFGELDWYSRVIIAPNRTGQSCA